MRFDYAKQHQHHEEQEQADRQTDPDGQGPQGATGVPRVLDQKEQTGGEAEYDTCERDQNDDFDPHDTESVLPRWAVYQLTPTALVDVRIANFEFRPALLPSLAFGTLFAMLLALGLWQVDRAGEKHETLQQRSERGRQGRLDLNNTLALELAERFRPVVVRGRYRDRHWLLDNRVLRGQAGYHVFTLFELDGPGGRVALVNRGWVDTGPSREFLPNVAAPEHSVELLGRLDLPESVGLELASADLAGLAPVTLVQHLDIGELAAALRRDLLPLAIVLDEGQPGGFVRDWVERPGITPEKHLGYAVQWFALALALLIIYLGVNTRRAHVTDRDRHATNR